MNGEIKEACECLLDWLWANPRKLETVIERDEVLAELRGIVGLVARQEAEYRAGYAKPQQ